MFRNRKRNTGWVWLETFPGPPKDLVRIMDQLTRLSPEVAEKVLVRVVQECQECGIAKDVAIPGEKRFMDRQYTRAVAALIEIAETGEGDDPAVEKARKVLETNRRAGEQHRSATGELVRPEIEEWMTEHWGPEESD